MSKVTKIFRRPNLKAAGARNVLDMMNCWPTLSKEDVWLYNRVICGVIKSIEKEKVNKPKIFSQKMLAFCPFICKRSRSVVFLLFPSIRAWWDFPLAWLRCIFYPHEKQSDQRWLGGAWFFMGAYPLITTKILYSSVLMMHGVYPLNIVGDSPSTCPFSNPDILTY